MEYYGVDGKIIHDWMDKPVLLTGPHHRAHRHDINIELPKKFIDKYGEELARNILVDHLILDKIDRSYVKVKKKRQKKYGKKEQVSFRVTSFGRQKLEYEAKQQGLDLSKYIRTLLGFNNKRSLETVEGEQQNE